jgi:diguanylate cyclase (GGDEF)-like protein
MRRRFWTWLFVLFVPAAAVHAASPWEYVANPAFVRIDTRGLPEEAAMSLAQDSQGFLWIGTQGGLARFDGYRYENFTPDASDPDALPDGLVRVLLPDADGGLWIGTSTAGLVHFDSRTEKFKTLRPDRSGRKGPHSAQINALIQDGPRIWVGGDSGLDLFDPRTGRFARIALRTGDQPPVWALLVDRAGTVWAGTQDGLYYRPARSAAFARYALGGAPVIYSLYEDTQGRVWAGSVNAAFRIDRARAHVLTLRSTHDAASLAPGQQWSIIETRPGTIWLGTDNAISIVDAATGSVTRDLPDPQNPGGLPSGRVQQMLRDRSGLIWIANHVGGLLLYNPISRGMHELSTTRSDVGLYGVGAVAVAAQPSGRLWVGGMRGALIELDPHRARVRSLVVPNHAAIQVLALARDGTMWIGTTGGLCKLDAHAGQATCPAGPPQIGTESIYALLLEGNKIWVGGSGGLMLADLGLNRAAAVPAPGSKQHLTNTQVRALYRDTHGRLWIGTEDGLNYLHDGVIHQLMFDPHDPYSIGSGGMTAFAEDRSGRIWAGANGGPLNVIRVLPNGRIHTLHIDTRDGMPHENVDGLMLGNDGRIWASTDAGIAAIDPQTLHVRAYGLADGVDDGAYWAGTADKFADGTIVFGSTDGVTLISPHASSRWNYAPPIVASALEIARRFVPAVFGSNAPNVKLPAGNRNLSVEFSALDYSASQALRYAYRLDGYDREWTYTDAQHRVAAYTHLPPGTYTLELRATNRLGVWSAPLRVQIYGAAAWYETWWFRAFIALLLLLGAYGVHQLRTRVLRERQRELEALVTERTGELSRANAKLQELSISDPLTGLRNRRFLTQHLGTDIAFTLRRYGAWLRQPGSARPLDADLLFFLIDFDRFKNVNDRYGHPAGDAVLMQMRERLLEVFRDSDFLVRWGGDEFLVVARGANRDFASEIAERVRVAIAGRAFTVEDGQSIPTSASIGFAAFPFNVSRPDALEWERVVAFADRALYMAKDAGRNTWFGITASGEGGEVRVISQAGEAEPEPA